MKESQKQHLINNATSTTVEDREIQEWYRMRWWMTVIATIQGCLHLFEYGASQTSGLYYFKEAFTVANPDLFYSLSIGINYVSGIIECYAIFFKGFAQKYLSEYIPAHGRNFANLKVRPFIR